MADWICRTLRDGGLEGEHAPALTINDTISCPLGSFVFDHILSDLSSFISSHKSNINGIVLVAFFRSPVYYEQLLKSKGDDALSSRTWFKVLDCFTDPVGWKSKLVETGKIRNPSSGSSVAVNLCKNVQDMDELLSSILDLGKELSVHGKRRFVVAIDSVTEMLRHTSVVQVAKLLSNLRSHDEVSSLFWLLNSDLHESRTVAALEYLSSMKATTQQMVRLVDGHKGNSQNISTMEHDLRKGKLSVHVKRRNGRVRMMFEELSVENSSIKFTSISSEDEITAQSLVPKVQFSLQLSEKERNDRAKVVLPFEHQGGDGRSIQIYDGRKSRNSDKDDSQPTSHKNSNTSRGEIVYFRDSDDDMPDSDEDPDDDLDI
ncbi:Elongator complex protein 5 [Striga hermonthica]|uniref:Elongator complex protein 5 n=1 Tax=Striga hermonthica TaxID=68872 RepID=A0A9N7RSI7_STRHE|nr:Elongator complex protein 5 [Striga hermonthica]